MLQLLLALVLVGLVSLIRACIDCHGVQLFFYNDGSKPRRPNGKVSGDDSVSYLILYDKTDPEYKDAKVTPITSF